MHSKLWKIVKILLAVLVLLTVNIGCAPVEGEDNMTHVEWTTFYLNRNHQVRSLCYRFDVNYDPFKEGQGTFSCFFVDKKDANCLLSSAMVTSEDLAELDAYPKAAAYGAGAKAEADGYAVCARCDNEGVLYCSWQL